MFTNRMRPIHPGEILREEYLVPMDMTPNALANALGLTAARVNEIVKGERGITPETALRLARYLNTTPEFWLHLQIAYELRKAEQEVGAKVQQEVQPLPVPA
jgi:addiction module HigA family antidote